MEFMRCYGCMEELTDPGAVCPRCGFDNTAGPGQQPNHVLPCGTVLNGQYIVGRSIGQGGFGITYIGLDLHLQTRVCIKEYYPEGAAMRSARQSSLVLWGSSENAQTLRQGRENFVKEARRAVRLRDLRHVVSVWGVFYENETSYIVMDYIEGQTLKKKLVESQRALGERDCIQLLLPVMEDLEQAHLRGIIHRDIKPDNLMLRPNGEVVLLDMGAAKDLSGGSSQSSFLVASQGFSPQEQYRANGLIGPWTDVYAMCATIYYCVSGRLLPTPMERMIQDEMNLSAFTPAVAAVIERGLAINPEQRIQNMGELYAALTAALRGEGGPSRGAEAGPAKTGPSTGPKARSGSGREKGGKARTPTALIAVLAAAVVVVGAAVLLLASRGGSDTVTVKTANTVVQALGRNDDITPEERTLIRQVTEMAEAIAGPSYDGSYYQFEIENTTGRTLEDVSFDMLYYDAGGAVIASYSGGVKKWEPGTSASPRIYCGRTDLDRAELKVEFTVSGGRELKTDYIPIEQTVETVTHVLDNTLPAVIPAKAYNSSGSYVITSFDYRTQSGGTGYYTTFRLGGYMEGGSAGNSYTAIQYKLTDANDAVVASGGVSFPALKDGEKFENVTFSAFNLKAGQYRLTLSAAS